MKKKKRKENVAYTLPNFSDSTTDSNVIIKVRKIFFSYSEEHLQLLKTLIIYLPHAVKSDLKKFRVTLYIQV